jgi:hypothetical protein
MVATLTACIQSWPELSVNVVPQLTGLGVVQSSAKPLSRSGQGSQRDGRHCRHVQYTYLLIVRRPIASQRRRRPIVTYHVTTATMRLAVP